MGCWRIRPRQVDGAIFRGDENTDVLVATLGDVEREAPGLVASADSRLGKNREKQRNGAEFAKASMAIVIPGQTRQAFRGTSLG